MAIYGTKVIAKVVNFFDSYSSEDQQSLLTVIEDYFTTADDQNEDVLEENDGGNRY